ncbi:hypothetical protein [Bacteriovorax sp. Seq25_V]|uniref:hypothetical protein n=1 Tax=Bacteriovorax sp. Seq25_V TaxID=1201288 RepID=UPI00038A1D9B|nr:hypothetical protein [Bacteriovorax sp. Seq25_V]EQC45390.1 hypothetical protein M900_2061 [Bacteriovorax sp. Seq25_V]
MKVLFILLSLLSGSFAYAESLDFRDIIQNRKDVKYIKLAYITRKGENLASIYKRFVRDDSIISKSEGMVEKTILSNPTIKTWDNLPPKKKLLIYLDVEYIDLDKVTKYNEKVAELSKRLKEALMKKRAAAPKTSGWRGSLFYMASYGKFTQDNPKLANITFLQNSPLSLGLSTSYYPENSNFSIASSLYFSYLLAAASNLGADNIRVPTEIGGNIYGEYRFTTKNFSGYAGIDYEKFTTFSLEGIQAEKKIYFDENSVFYLTVGAAKKVKIYKWDFFAKLSLSQSIASSRTPGFSGATGDTPFTGNKILFYLFRRVNDKFFAHTLFKYHWMSGPSDITTLRLGVGFGYLLF